MDDAFIGEIRIIPWNWAPEGWFLCNGQSLPVNQFPALFSILGYRFGGTLNVKFNLPDLQGRAVAGYGQGIGLSNLELGERYGYESVTLDDTTIPPHNHNLFGGASSAGPSAYVPTPANDNYIGHVPGIGQQSFTSQAGPLIPMSVLAISPVGGDAAHENRQPFLVMNYIICYDGEYPIHP
ncbi:phage tail protein [Pseudomonas sp. C11]|uniref:phage tail protein n=1 Tax=Pseudomonas sp. C11 TaxID=3075550 RepID=UPI002AFF247A|nr:tail fiber protein [Pseudomonas sp. C11]